VAGRFSVRDLAEALILPSKVISDQYRGTLIVTVDGKVITGRLAGEQDGILTVLTDPYDSNKVTEIKKDDVDELRPAPKSLMPEDLINELNADEVRNLIAYMLSRGNPNDRMFQK
jgi:putative heme-binding domain-containing protein